MMTPRGRKEVDQDTFTGRFAVRLKTLREKAGLTVEEAAARIGTPYKSLYNWESARSVPPLETFPVIADAYGIKVRTLLPEK